MTTKDKPTVEGLMALVSEYGHCRWSEGSSGATYLDRMGERHSREEAVDLYAQIKEYAHRLSELKQESGGATAGAGARPCGLLQCPEGECCKSPDCKNLPSFSRIAGVRASATYRLLEHGEVIQRDDEVLGDDTVTWHPVDRWAVGTQWDSGAYVPVRRRTSGVPGTVNDQGEKR